MATSNDSSAISLEELKQVSKALQSQKDTIYSLYKKNIVSVLESSRSCFKVAGVDFTNIENTFRSIYTELNRNYESLINVLNNNVIAGYSEVSETIKRMFNKEFATKLNEILGTVKTTK